MEKRIYFSKIFYRLIQKIFEKINYNFGHDENNKFPSIRTYHNSNYDEEKQIIYIYGRTDMNISSSKNNKFQRVCGLILVKKFLEKN